MINDRDTGYIYYINTVETTIPIEPSDALGSTPLTIRNIAMGNLLPMAKSVSRRIRRDAGRRRRRRRRRAERTVWPAATDYGWLLFITYKTILRPSPTRFRCRSRVPRPRKAASPMSNRRDFHNRPPSFRYVVLVASGGCLFFSFSFFHDRID